MDEEIIKVTPEEFIKNAIGFFTEELVENEDYEEAAIIANLINSF